MKYQKRHDGYVVTVLLGLSCAVTILVLAGFAVALALIGGTLLGALATTMVNWGQDNGRQEIDMRYLD